MPVNINNKVSVTRVLCLSKDQYLLQSSTLLLIEIVKQFKVQIKYHNVPLFINAYFKDNTLVLV